MRGDDGFMTPAFGGVAIALALVAFASARLAQTEEIASRRGWEKTQELYRAEGVATIAAWRVLHMDGAPTLAWTEPTDLRPMAVWAEPEHRKLGLAEIGGQQGRSRLSALLGAQEAERLVSSLGTWSQPPSRLTLRSASPSPAWRACGLTLVSTQSRLTNNALSPVQTPVTAALDLRAGEVWRIAISSEGRLVLDRLVRFTGDAQRPVAVLDQLRDGPSPDPSCMTRFALENRRS